MPPPPHCHTPLTPYPPPKKMLAFYTRHAYPKPEQRYRGDSQSRRYDSKLSVAYKEHPQRDSLPLVGEVAYPNLDFEYTKVGATNNMLLIFMGV